MQHVNVRLYWEGSWDVTDRQLPESLPNTPGIYMIVAERITPNQLSFIDDESNLRLVYIGETEHLRKSLNESKRWGDWEKYGKGYRLLLKVAKTDRVECRRKIASLLTFQNKPACNTRYNNVALITCLQLNLSHSGCCQPLKNASPAPVWIEPQIMEMA